jgi:hypothetical protein
LVLAARLRVLWRKVGGTVWPLMGAVLHVMLSLPTAVYTVLLGVAMLYWCSVMLGALDLDVLGGGEHGDAGAHDLGGDHADAGGDVGDGDAGDGDDGAHHGGLGAVLSALGGASIRRVPITVSMSFAVISAWLICVMGELILAPMVARAGAPTWVFDLTWSLAALVVGLRITGFVVRPMAPLFASRGAQRKTRLAGRVGEVSTARLDARFGQVLIHDGGAGLLVDARYDGDHPLRRGDKIVVTAWDEDRSVATVEPLDQGVRVHITQETSEAYEGESTASAKGRSESR